jgi:hypothetical protein
MGANANIRKDTLNIRDRHPATIQLLMTYLVAMRFSRIILSRHPCSLL